MLDPGQVVGFDSDEGRSISLTCGEDAATLVVSYGDRDKLMEQEDVAITNTTDKWVLREAGRVARLPLPLHVRVRSRLAVSACGSPGFRVTCAGQAGSRSVGHPLRRYPHHERHGARGRAPREVLSDH